MNRPNLFANATKELSQDGFLSWLMKWADPAYAAENANLCKCAQDFLKLLIVKSGQIPLADDFVVTSVEAGRQREKIDVWANVNENILIIIEDKTQTDAHDNQLARYKEFAQGWCDDNNRQLVCIYLKTGSEAKSSLDAVAQQGFSVIDRTTLIECLSAHAVKSDIFTDFVTHLKDLDAAEKSFESKKIKDWDDDYSWHGLYRFLDTRLEVTDWQYVFNRDGGFWGLWWHFLKWKDYKVYLQIEQGNLCLKIGDVFKNHSEVRTEWAAIISEQATSEGKSEITKPQKFGSGTCMTVAIVQRQDWLGADDSVIDKEKVIAKLKGYEEFLNHCLNTSQL
jgi:hypothetical protein